jgi:sugar (pentulose or hexulose) kinase
MIVNYMLGIDAGSSAVKTALFDTDGSMQAVSIQEYEFQTPSPNVVEIDAAVFWEKMKLGLGEVLARTGIAPGDIAALGISSQGETFVPMGKDGAPLRPAIFWLDGRATKQAEDIASAFTRENIFEVTGMPEIIPMWTAGKILWIKDNEPEVFSNAHKYLLVEDYLIFRLTGCHVGEFSLYPSTLFLDITRKRLWQEMLDFVGVREDQFVELKESGEPVGPITAEAARELGLSTGTIVATGGYGDHGVGAGGQLYRGAGDI